MCAPDLWGRKITTIFLSPGSLLQRCNNAPGRVCEWYSLLVPRRGRPCRLRDVCVQACKPLLRDPEIEELSYWSLIMAVLLDSAARSRRPSFPVCILLAAMSPGERRVLDLRCMFLRILLTRAPNNSPPES